MPLERIICLVMFSLTHYMSFSCSILLCLQNGDTCIIIDLLLDHSTCVMSSSLEPYWYVDSWIFCCTIMIFWTYLFPLWSVTWHILFELASWLQICDVCSFLDLVPWCLSNLNFDKLWDMIRCLRFYHAMTYLPLDLHFICMLSVSVGLSPKCKCMSPSVGLSWWTSCCLVGWRFLGFD